ncbi:hypothetical protein LJG15_24610 [Pseudomonas aeruginosa]|uniref:hypothetical protein n=1 Tax=Pseudomonas aeruginosa TaxID=287 RepID=UPI001D09DE85|nr:hypothetical protein [Pseudomonas aeruginosa]MCC0353265.1 hypothetical protein [Pseudomonas aeruginosa]
MSKHTHTPGPWQWSHGRLLHNVPGEYSDTILDIQDKVWRPTEEDARLIVAAPDLLEALVALVECEQTTPELWEAARAAIEKATA